MLSAPPIPGAGRSALTRPSARGAGNSTNSIAAGGTPDKKRRRDAGLPKQPPALRWSKDALGGLCAKVSVKRREGGGRQGRGSAALAHRLLNIIGPERTTYTSLSTSMVRWLSGERAVPADVGAALDVVAKEIGYPIPNEPSSAAGKMADAARLVVAPAQTPRSAAPVQRADQGREAVKTKPVTKPGIAPPFTSSPSSSSRTSPSPSAVPPASVPVSAVTYTTQAPIPAPLPPAEPVGRGRGAKIGARQSINRVALARSLAAVLIENVAALSAIDDESLDAGARLVIDKVGRLALMRHRLDRLPHADESKAGDALACRILQEALVCLSAVTPAVIEAGDAVIGSPEMPF